MKRDWLRSRRALIAFFGLVGFAAVALIVSLAWTRTQSLTNKYPLQGAQNSLSAALNDPNKVKLLECQGVRVYEEPQPPGHPPSPEECAKIERAAGVSGPGIAESAQPKGDAQDIQVVTGECAEASALAEGDAGEDLRNRKSRFYCNAAVIIFFDSKNKHLLLQFSQKDSHHGKVIGFGGDMDGAGQVLTVDHLYLEPGKPLPATDAACKFFFAHKHMTDIVCGATVYEESHRTVATVVFKLAPGQ